MPFDTAADIAVDRAPTGRGWSSRRAVPFALAAGIALVLLPTIPSQVAAHGEGHARSCSERTLRGDYGLLVSGVRAVPPPLGGGTERFVATALWTFDGQGAFTQGTGAALRGEVTGTQPDTGEIPGTYVVNENCTGTMELLIPGLPVPIQYSMVIVDDAREVKAIVVSGGATTATLTRR